MIHEQFFSEIHLTLREITEKDTDVLVDWRSDPTIIQYFYNPKPVTCEAHLHWFYEVYLKDKCRYDFLVLDGLTPVGFAALTHIDFNRKSCEISYTIGNIQYRGRGLGKKIIELVVALGCDRFGITEFIAEVHKENIPSQKAALSAGFYLKYKKETFWTYERKL